MLKMIFKLFLDVVISYCNTGWCTIRKINVKKKKGNRNAQFVSFCLCTQVTYSHQISNLVTKLDNGWHCYFVFVLEFHHLYFGSNTLLNKAAANFGVKLRNFVSANVGYLENIALYFFQVSSAIFCLILKFNLKLVRTNSLVT